MILTIDSGNTSVIFALFEQDRLHSRWRISTVAGRSCDEYGSWLMSLMARGGIQPSDIEGVVIANVVPDAQSELDELSQRYFHCQAMVLGYENQPLHLAVDYPREVGADRIANAFALYRHGTLPSVAIDFGTATTFDVVDAQGAYLGGAILPGIDLSLRILHTKTACLPHTALAGTPSVIGRSTLDAIRSGIFWGTIGQVEGMLARIIQQIGQDVYAVATGGFGQQCADKIAAINEYDANLTVRGLLQLYHENQKTHKGGKKKNG